MLLLGIVCLVYYHSLFHAPRADQLVYLYQTVDHGGLWRLLLGTYALNRCPPYGDELLFRPLLYAVLALERWAWGYRFLLWQATSLAVHVAIVLSLHQHLRRVLSRTSPLPFLLALLQGVLYAGMELVVWHHIVGYLVFGLCLVRADQALHQLRAGSSGRAPVALVLWCALGALCYELGNVMAVLFALGLLWVRWRGGLDRAARRRAGSLALWLLLVPLAYAAWSALDYRSRFGAGLGRPAPVGLAGLWGLASAYARVVLAWSAAIGLPASLHMSVGERMRSAGIVGAADLSGALWLGVGLVPLLLSGGGAAGLIWAGRRALRAGPERVPALVLAVLAAAYALVIVLGRSAREGVAHTLAHSPYYTYLFALLLLLVLGHVLAGAGAAAAAGGRPGRGLLIGLGGLCVLSAWQTWAMNAHLRYQHGRPRLLLIEAAQQVLREHPGEPDLTLSVSPECDGQQALPWFARYDPRREPRLLSILFPRQVRARGGAYQILCPLGAAPSHRISTAPR